MVFHRSGQGATNQPAAGPQSQEYSQYYEQYWQNYAAWQNYGNYYDPSYAYAQQVPPQAQIAAAANGHYPTMAVPVAVPIHGMPHQPTEDEYELVGKRLFFLLIEGGSIVVSLYHDFCIF